MAAHILLSLVGQKTETRFNCLLTENRKSTEMMVEARCYQNDSWSARRVIGATAKPLYPIDGKAEGLDRRNPKTSLFEGGGPSADGGRSIGAPDSFSHGCAVPAPSKRELFGRVISRLSDKSHIARPRFVQNLLFAQLLLYKNLREGARRVIGATAKPLYPIDGKAEGLDRRTPRPPSSREGDRPQTVEGVSRQWKEFSVGKRRIEFPKSKFMRQNAEPCACLRRILLNFIFNSARSVNVPAFFGREPPPRTQEI